VVHDPSGDTYEGEWRGGLFSGIGMYHFANGSMFEGIFRLDCPQSGIFRESDGKQYEVQLPCDQLQGHHKLESTDCMYDGEWNEGRWDGFGRWAHAKMGAYVGQWSAGLFHGKGSYKYPDGEKYEGEWVSGKQHGKGKQFFSQVGMYEGEFELGQLQGMGNFR
ncbi:hypothetical protein GUITHDRAFT_54039, partial [Guillardia theta CCMP2712]